MPLTLRTNVTVCLIISSGTKKETLSKDTKSLLYNIVSSEDSSISEQFAPAQGTTIFKRPSLISTIGIPLNLGGEWRIPPAWALSDTVNCCNCIWVAFNAIARKSDIIVNILLFIIWIIKNTDAKVHKKNNYANKNECTKCVQIK